MTKAFDLLKRLVMRQAGDHADWVGESLQGLAAGGPERSLHIHLGLCPRRLGKADLAVTLADAGEADAALPGWSLEGWTVDGAARVLGLVAYRARRPFAEVFKDLRRTADMAELVALYRGLPLYPEPESLDFETGEGLRSNLKPVFEAIAHRNPFPCDQFDEHRWNHMVLKALFIGSDLAPIVGLDRRANPQLALILIDYGRERRAAGRPVSDELWRQVQAFANRSDVRAALDRARADGLMPQREPA